SVSRNAFISAPGTLRIFGTNQIKNITLLYSGPFVPGTVATGSQFTGEFRDENGNLYTSIQGGSINFSTFDTTSRTVSGTYQFIASPNSGSTSIIVSSGVFNVLNY
ncbi:MAG TPA: DUF6252 family protein, partial [Bacteroidia bacterium]|nr:DUF6252 family protein [Bacteroidia bacterium]